MRCCYWWVCFLFFQLVLAISCIASTSFNFKIELEPFEVQGHDGTALVMFRLIHPDPPNGKKIERPVLLLEPGLTEAAQILGGIASAFYKRGYNIYVGQVRLAGHGGTVSGAGPLNGLAEVFRDFETHVEYVAATHPKSQIHLLGHSMGGMEIMAYLSKSDSEKKSEIESRIAAVTTVGSPVHLRDLPFFINVLAKQLEQLMNRAQKLKKDRISVHKTYFEFLNSLKKQRWNPLFRFYAKAIESLTLTIVKEVLFLVLLSRDLNDEFAMKHVIREQVSSIPVDLLLDFLHAAKVGDFVTSQGKPIFYPENIKIPFQVVSMERDHLVSVASQEALFESLGSKYKQFLLLRGMKHVDPVTSDLEKVAVMDPILKFHLEPKQTSIAYNRMEITPRKLQEKGGLLKTCRNFLIKSIPYGNPT